MKKNKNSKRKIFTFFAFAFAVILVMPERVFSGSEIDEAKARFKKGLMFVDEGDCKKAVVEFEEAYKIYPSPAILYNMALCYDDMHQYAFAMKYYQKFLSESKKVPEKQAEKIKERIAKLSDLLGIVSIKCNVDGATVIIDGNEMGTTPIENFYLETGSHTLTIIKEKYVNYTTNFKLISGKTVTIEANMEPVVEKVEPVKEEPQPQPPAPVETPQKEKKAKKLNPAIFLSMIGIAVLTGAGSAVAGGLNISNHNEFLDTPYSEKDKWQDLKDKGETLNIAFIALIAVTGASLVTGAALAPFTDFGKLKKKGSEEVDVGFNPTLNGGLIFIKF